MRRRWLVVFAIVTTLLVTALALLGAGLGGWRCIGDDPTNATAWACGNTPGVYAEILCWVVVLICPLAAAAIGTFAIKRSRGGLIVLSTFVLGVAAFLGNAYFWGYAGT
jgi:hypothetical protein